MQRSIPPFRILLTDHTAPLCVIIPLAIWGVTIAGCIFDPDIYSFALPIAPVITVAGFALALWQVWAIRSVFVNGTEVSGVIDDAAFFRGRGRIRFSCTHLSEEYGGSHRVQATRAAAPWQPGQQVTVSVGSVIPNSSRGCEGTSALSFRLVSEKDHDLRTLSRYAAFDR